MDLHAQNAVALWVLGAQAGQLLVRDDGKIELGSMLIYGFCFSY
jgi:hypothetical protein